MKTHRLFLAPAKHLLKFSLCAYCDSYWASDPNARHSTSRSYVLFGPNLVAWSSKKQGIIVNSSTKAEYRDLAHTTLKFLCLESLLFELHIEYLEPTLLCDNLSGMLLSHNPILNAITKYIEFDIHFPREKVMAKHLHIQHLLTHAQLANVLIKPLLTMMFNDF